jgi:hypothetical protein
MIQWCKTLKSIRDSSAWLCAYQLSVAVASFLIGMLHSVYWSWQRCYRLVQHSNGVVSFASSFQVQTHCIAEAALAAPLHSSLIAALLRCSALFVL